MASPLHNLGLRFAYTVSTNIRPEMLTAHYGGPTPWPASADRSTPARFRDTTNHAQCPSIVRAYHDFHINGRGWAGFAYSSAVCPHGHRYEGRGPGRRTGANGTNSGNLRSYATVYLAGKTDDGRFDPLTDEAKVAFLGEAERLGVPLLRNHSDWKSTDCAGSPIRAWQHAGWPRPQGDEMTPEQERKLDEVLTIVKNTGSNVWGYKLSHRGRKAPALVFLVDLLVGQQEGQGPLLRSIAEAVKANPEAIAAATVAGIKPVLRDVVREVIGESQADEIVDLIAARLLAGTTQG